MRDYSMPNLSQILDGTIVRFNDVDSKNAYDSFEQTPYSPRSRANTNDQHGKLPKTRTF